MRWLIDLLIVVMLAAAVYGGWWVYTYQQRQATDLEQVHAALQRLHEQARYHRAMGRAEQELGLEPPPLVSEQWFGPTLPTNPYALADGQGRPWLDIAPEGDFEPHPPDPVLTGADQAQFWFNPQLGVFRARVPAQASSRETRELYNTVNQTTLATLPDQTLTQQARLTRQPTPYTPARVIVTAEPGRSLLVEPFVEPYGVARRDAAAQRPQATTAKSLSAASAPGSAANVAVPSAPAASAPREPAVIPPSRRPSLKDR